MQFYDSDRVGTLFYPDMEAIEQDALAVGAVNQTEQKNIHLVLIDMQVDFCHEQGQLYVPGALDDIRRVCDFIGRNSAEITQITATLDSHLPFHIFHPPWWVDANGNHPDPFTLITHADLLAGKWHATLLPEYSIEYTRRLEEDAKKVLTIWPFHTLIGSMGTALDPMLWSVIMWHSLARQAQPNWVIKGTIPQTEHYSAIQPEIPVPNHPSAGRDEAFLAKLDASDVIIIAGEAESHCVLATVGDLVNHYADHPERLRSIYVLQDCMSPVQHPEIDFHALAWEQYRQYAAMGVNFVDSDQLTLAELE